MQSASILCLLSKRTLYFPSAGGIGGGDDGGTGGGVDGALVEVMMGALVFHLRQQRLDAPQM